MLNLLTTQISDEYVRENFQRILDQVGEDPLWGGIWVKKEFTFRAAVTNQKLPHGLNFIPTDVLVMSITGAGAITVNYALIDATNLNFTTTGACVARLLVGRMGG